MALFVITAARFDDAGELKAFRCNEADGETDRTVGDPFMLSAGQVAERLVGGDTFEPIFSAGPHRVSDGALQVSMRPDGVLVFSVERGGPDRIRELPRF